MSFYVVPGGPNVNLLKTAATVTPTPAADASFPVGYLYDGRSNVPFRFGSVAADSVIVVDLTYDTIASGVAINQGFESGVSAWTAVSGTMTQSNTTANTGTYSAKFAAAGSSYYQFYALPGQQRQVSAALYGGGGSVSSWLRVYCVETGLYLQSGGASWGASADLFTRTTASWATSTQAYTAPTSADLLGAEACRLRVYIGQTNAGTTYRDDILDVPGVTWASVHGHNIPPVLVPTIDSSTDGAAWTTRISPTLRQGSFYGTCSAIYARYWRLKLAGTPVSAPYLGEWVLGQYLSLTCAPDYPVSVDYPEAQSRQTTPQGSQHVGLYGGAPARRLTMSFRFRNDTEFQQVRDVIYRLGRGGAWPSVWVPTETDPDVCILGRTQDELLTQRVSYAIRTGEIEVLEEPLPLME